MATSYFRERARNPYLRQPIAPVFEEPATDPTFSQSMPMAPGVVGRPPLRAEAPPVTPSPLPAAFSMTDPLKAASEAYVADAPTTFGGKVKDVLKSAALGFLTSAARNAENPLAAGAGGALTGGAIQAISPQTGRAFQFETVERPQIEEEMRREEERRQRVRQAATDELKTREIQAEINLKGAQAKKALTPEAPRAVTPQMKLGRNRQTGQTTYFNALDPAQNEAFEPIAESPFRSGTQGIYRADTGEIVTPAAEKQAEPPAGAREALNSLDQLKTEAMEAWRQWGSPELAEGEADTAEAKAERQRAASEAQARYNQAAQRFGELYGKWFETGGFNDQSGNQGWAYVKRREQPQARGAAAKGGKGAAQPSAYKRNVNQLPPLR